MYTTGNADARASDSANSDLPERTPPVIRVRFLTLIPCFLLVQMLCSALWYRHVL